MKQHRPRVSEENYQRVMSHLMGRFGESETFDNALWLLLTEYEDLKNSRKINNSTIRLLTKELGTSADLLVVEYKKARKMQSLAITGYIGVIGLLAYIGFCLW